MEQNEDVTATGPAPTAPPAESGFRWRLDHRPDLRFGHAAGGVAGVMAAAAVVAFAAAVDSDTPRLPGAAFSLVLIAVAVVAGLWVRGPVRSAAVGAIVATVPLLWLFAVLGGGDRVERGDVRLVLLLTIVTYLGFSAVTFTKGRAVLLGLALLLAASWIVFEVADQQTPFNADRVSQVEGGGVGSDTSALGANNTDAAAPEILIAVVLLGGGIVLDRRGRHGVATPCLLVGTLYAILGAVAAGDNNAYATGALLAVAGLAIGLAGSLGHRRATSWIGAVTLFAGILVMVSKGASGSASETKFGVLALVGAAVLLGVGVVLARALDEPVDGGEPDA